MRQVRQALPASPSLAFSLYICLCYELVYQSLGSTSSAVLAEYKGVDKQQQMGEKPTCVHRGTWHKLLSHDS